MKCTKFIKSIGPFIDGELVLQERDRLEGHLQSCPECKSRLENLKALRLSLSSLPEIEPTASESYRLMNRVRAEMAAPVPGKIGHARLRVTAAALTLLVAASIGTTWAILAQNEPAVQSGSTSEEPGLGVVDGMMEGAEAVTTGQLAMVKATGPATSVTQNNYSTAELKSFRNDLGPRLDFYSSYWYPAVTSGLDTAALSENQARLTQAIGDQAAQSGKNPEEAKEAVNVALAEAQQSVPLLPCYAEQAKVDGKDAWLISLSGPEDYLLFSNQEMPKAMYMAAQGGEASLKISESLLNQLATMVAPFYAAAYASAQQKTDVLGGSSTPTSDSSTSTGTSGYESFLDTPLSQLQGELSAEQQQQFQAFMRQLAAQSNNLDLLLSLQGLNYDQLLMLIQGNWSGLAAQGVDLTQFLVPPKRLYAVDPVSGTIIWAGTKK
jgi:Putative zinc-finger